MRILILGGTGMLGHKLYQTLSKVFDDVHVSFRKSKTEVRQYSLFVNSDKLIDQLNIEDHGAVKEVLKRVKPDVICNCIGMTIRKMSRVDSAQVIYVNSLFPHQLKRWVEDNGAKLIHFSTDCVFSGEKGNYSEDDKKDAQDLYGLSKSLGEVGGSNSLTLRSSIIGRELLGKTELLEWFLNQKDTTVSGFSNVLYSGVTTNEMSKIVVGILKSKNQISGIYQVASRPISKFKLLEKVNSKFNCEVNLVKESNKISNKILNGSRFEKQTGIQVPSWDYMIDEMAKESQEYEAWR